MNSSNLSHGLFCDELEIEKTENQSLTLYYFGILIKSEIIADIEEQVIYITKNLGKESFHSVKHYKDEANWVIWEKFNEIIIKNKLKILCFPFVKDWLELNELKVINSLVFPEWANFPITNYRAKAFCLFLHVLNYYLANYFSGNTHVRVFMDKDWLKIGTGITHQGIILHKVESIFSSRQKRIPVLALSDHVAYMYNKLIKSNHIKLQKPDKLTELKDDKLIEMSWDAYKSFCTQHLFKFLDLKEWTRHESTKYEKS